MKTVSIRDLHMRTGQIVDQAAQGEPVVIARRGRPVAELRPVSEKSRLKAFPPDHWASVAKLLKVPDSGRWLEKYR